MENKGRVWWDQRVAMARLRLRSPMDLAKLAGGVVVIVLGTLLIAEGVVGVVTGTTLFFEGVNRGFEFLVGLVAIIVGASMTPERKGPVAAESAKPA